MSKIKAMIVDDSALVRQVISDILNSDPAIEVIATAADPIFAMKKMEKDWPDVIILDVEMPRMDGITFLRKIMTENPTPVVLCSTLTEKGTEITMNALAAGAVGIITKPQIGIKDFLNESAIRLLDAVKSAAGAKVKKIEKIKEKNKIEITPRQNVDAVLRMTKSTNPIPETTDKVIAIGASTGGTQAIESVLKALPKVIPGIVIVQHMPETFTKAFAERLDKICEIDVAEAVHWERVIPGRALIAPGNKHMLLKRSGARYHVEVKDGPLVNRHRPSVDVLFRSVAKEAGNNALGIILTGMGDDGASGMLDMHNNGALCIAQNEASSIVFGMPREAIRKNAVDEILPLDKVPEAIIKYRAENQH